MILGMANAQNHDYVWSFGYSGDFPGPDWEATFLDFKTRPPTSIPSSHPMWLRATQASVSDEHGNLLAFTNGIYIADRNGDLIENGDSLNPGYYYDQFWNVGYPAPNSAFFLPSHKDSNVYYLFHIAYDDQNYPSRLLRTTVDFSYNQGLGKVIEKNKIISTGLFDFIGATRHANGRDWWIITRDETFYSNKFIRWLIMPDTIIGPQIQQIGSGITDNGIGGVKCIFSKDGTTFVRPDRFEGIQVFDFDRCSGLLSNPRIYNEPGLDTVQSINGEISPNGRFLYFNSNVTIYQLDLWNDTLNNQSLETVARYDGFIYSAKSTTFNRSQLGPDEKIYISCTTTAPFLHVIHNPNEKGTSCNVEQHGIRLAGYHAFSMPYYPNYRLGPITGSPCDTLTGIEEVDPSENKYIRLFPNPADSDISLLFEGYYNGLVKFHLFNLAGQKVRSNQLDGNVERHSLNIENLAAGIYFYQVQVDGVIMKVGKVVLE